MFDYILGTQPNQPEPDFDILDFIVPRSFQQDALRRQKELQAQQTANQAQFEHYKPSNFVQDPLKHVDASVDAALDDVGRVSNVIAMKPIEGVIKTLQSGTVGQQGGFGAAGSALEGGLGEFLAQDFEKGLSAGPTPGQRWQQLKQEQVPGLENSPVVSDVDFTSGYAGKALGLDMLGDADKKNLNAFLNAAGIEIGVDVLNFMDIVEAPRILNMVSKINETNRIADPVQKAVVQRQLAKEFFGPIQEPDFFRRNEVAAREAEVPPALNYEGMRQQAQPEYHPPILPDQDINPGITDYILGTTDVMPPRRYPEPALTPEGQAALPEYRNPLQQEPLINQELVSQITDLQPAKYPEPALTPEGQLAQQMPDPVLQANKDINAQELLQRLTDADRIASNVQAGQSAGVGVGRLADAEMEIAQAQQQLPPTEPLQAADTLSQAPTASVLDFIIGQAPQQPQMPRTPESGYMGPTGDLVPKLAPEPLRLPEDQGPLPTKIEQRLKVRQNPYRLTENQLFDKGVIDDADIEAAREAVYENPKLNPSNVTWPDQLKRLVSEHGVTIHDLRTMGVTSGGKSMEEVLKRIVKRGDGRELLYQLELRKRVLGKLGSSDVPQQTVFKDSTPMPKPKQQKPKLMDDVEPEKEEPLVAYTHGKEPIKMGGMDKIRPVPLPKMLQLSKEITGQLPGVKAEDGVRGSYSTKTGQITLNPQIFNDERVAAKVLAHEIGHAADLAPASTNPTIVGIKNVKKHLSSTYSNLDKQMKAELQALSDWWRPRNEAEDRTVRRYRESKEELFADFMSVLFNDPAEVQSKAPRFFESFMKSLDKKPEVANALGKVYDDLAGPEHALVDELMGESVAAFKEGDQIFKSVRENAQRKRLSYFEQLRQELVDAFYPAKKKQAEIRSSKSIKDLDPKDLEITLEEFQMGNVKVASMLSQQHNNTGMKELDELGVSREDVGLYMLSKRIAEGDREGLPNPFGYTPSWANKTLDRIKETLGKDKFGKLETTSKKLHELWWGVMEEAKEAGLVSQKTFDELTGSKDNYATFAVLKYLDGHIPSTIYAQKGTFEPIANPYTATTVKMISTLRMIEHNKARSALKDFYTSYFPESWVKAEGKKRPPRGMAEVMVMEDGKPVRYHVDEYLSDMLDSAKPTQIDAWVRAITFLDRPVFKKFWLALNPAFTAFNVIRDSQRTLTNLVALGAYGKVGTINPLTYARFAKDYAGALLPALSTASKRNPGNLLKHVGAELPDDSIINQMMDEYALGTPYDAWGRHIDEDTSDYIDMEMRRNGVFVDGNKKASTIVSKLGDTMNAMLDTWGVVRDTMELVPKIAGYNRLKKTGLDTKVRSHYVRDYVGTPNYRVKGSKVHTTNELFTFMNIMVQGFRTDARIATSPKTRGAWWAQTGAQVIFPTAMMAMAANGFLSKSLEKLYDKVSEYDKTNYMVIPIGWTKEGEEMRWADFGGDGSEIPEDAKAVVIRIPRNETQKVLGGLFYKTMDKALKKEGVKKEDVGDLAAGVLEFFGGQMPGTSATIDSVQTWWDVMGRGVNPPDSFYGKPKVDKDRFQAGEVDKWERFHGTMEWQFKQLGPGGDMLRGYFYDPRQDKTIETGFQVPLGLGRFVKITDSGERAADYEKAAINQAQKIKEKLVKGREGKKTGAQSSLEWLIEKYHSLKGKPDKTAAERKEWLASNQFYSNLLLPRMENMQGLSKKKADDEFMDLMKIADGIRKDVA